MYEINNSQKYEVRYERFMSNGLGDYSGDKNSYSLGQVPEINSNYI